jgi:hypothetical protein
MRWLVRLFDGALGPTESVSRYFHEPAPIEPERNLVPVFREIRDAIVERRGGTTIAGMV